MCSTPRSGKSIAISGSFPAVVPTVGFGNRPTAATPGPRSAKTWACPKVSKARSASRRHLPSLAGSGRWSNPSKSPALFRSDDFGVTWQKMIRHARSAPPALVLQPRLSPIRSGCRHRLCAQPRHVEIDRRRQNFSKIATPHGDNHDLWIDPRNTSVWSKATMVVPVSPLTVAKPSRTIYNQMTAPFYNIAATDNHFPYRVYGTQQDNSSISVPSNTNERRHCLDVIVTPPAQAKAATLPSIRTIPTWSMWARWAVRRGASGRCNATIIAPGRFNWSTSGPNHTVRIGPKELKYRFPWTFPILFSPHDPNVLYTCANVVFRSTDEGACWQPFSPDLTRNDLNKLGPSGGPITIDTSGAEHYCTIFTFRESPHEAGLFWSGSDDGLLHLSRDNGQRMAKCDAARPARVELHSRRRTVAARSGDALSGGDPLQARRQYDPICTKPPTTAKAGSRLRTASPPTTTHASSAPTPKCRGCSLLARKVASISRGTTAFPGSAGRPTCRSPPSMTS